MPTYGNDKRTTNESRDAKEMLETTYYTHGYDLRYIQNKSSYIHAGERPGLIQRFGGPEHLLPSVTKARCVGRWKTAPCL